MKMVHLFRTGSGKRFLNQISRRRFCSIYNESEGIEPETNFVKFIGSAWDNSKQLPSGGLSCKVVQRCKNDAGQQFSISHMINIPPKVQKLCGVESLARGQSFNINGYVRSIPFEIASGKTRRAIAIIPYEIEVYENGLESNQDVCIVMMTAFIESKIFNQRNIMSFHLRTHVPVRNKETGFTGETVEYSHSIVVTDSNMQRYIRSNITQYDKVFVEGYLNYQPVQMEDGSKRMSGNIVPVHIEKA